MNLRWVAVLLIGWAGARADILELQDGSVLNGTFLGSTAEVMRFRVGSLDLEFPTGDVLALTMAGTPTPAPTAPPPVTSPVPPAAPSVPGTITIPAGTSLLIRMSDTVSTRNSAGRRFGARLDSDIRVDGVLVAPAGSQLYGRVEESRQAGRLTGSSHLEIGLNEIKIRGKRHSIVTTDYRVRAGSSTANTAINTGVGAGIGAAFGGGRGAGRGAAVGGGASALSSAEVATISSGQLIEFRLLEPLTVPR